MGYWPANAEHLAEDLDTLAALRDTMAERAELGETGARLVMQVVTVFIAELETAGTALASERRALG